MGALNSFRCWVFQGSFRQADTPGHVWNNLCRSPALRASLARCAGCCLHGQAWQTSACQCPTSQHGIIYDPLLGVFGGSAMPAQHTVHRLSLWLARRFGTLYQTAWEIRILASTASDICWRLIHLHCTEAFSVLEMFQDDMLHNLTYLLTSWHKLERLQHEGKEIWCGSIYICIWHQ